MRKTWLARSEWNYQVKSGQSVKDVEVQHVFLLGRDENKTSYPSLVQESEDFEDILLGDYEDSFQNLSIKEHSFLDLVNDLGTENIDFIYKGDSDVLVNPPMLIQSILKSNEDRSDFILGCRSLYVLPYVGLGVLISMNLCLKYQLIETIIPYD